MLAQPGERESVAQAVGGDLGSGQPGASDQSGDGVLHRADRHRGVAAGAKHRSIGRCRRLLFEQLAQGTARRGIQGHLAFLETLAVPYPHRAGAIAKNDVAAPQSGHLTDSQAGLKHQLDERVIAPRQPVQTLTGRAQ